MAAEGFAMASECKARLMWASEVEFLRTLAATLSDLGLLVPARIAECSSAAIQRAGQTHRLL